jgi:CelD/BcsL family acetyltransferase involved in cellulose biosynthesis
MIAVEELTPALEGAYDAFLRGRPDGLLYQSLPYRALLKSYLQCEDRYLVAVDGGEVQGILPLMAAGERGGRVWNSLPYYGSHGGVLAASPAAGDALLNAYADIAADATTLASTVSPNPFVEAPGPAPLHNVLDRRISQQTPIDFDDDVEERIMGVIEGSARRNVRKAQRSGIVAEVDPGAMSDLVRIHRENILSIGGLAKDMRFFETVQGIFESGHDYDLWVGRHEGVVVAALLVFYFNETVEYFTPTVEHDFRALEPMAVVLLAAMAAAARRGMKRWNWGGTWESQSGVFRFKRKWGAIAKPFCYYTQLNDRSLLTWPRERFAEKFPHFFVVPFSALEPAGSIA